MSMGDAIEEFLAELARMDDRTIGLLGAYFHARDTAWRKLAGLAELSGPGRGDERPAWAAWHETVPGRRQPGMARLVAGLIRRELDRREEAAERADRARQATLTARDAAALTDDELATLRRALDAPLATPRSRWLLLAELGELWEGDSEPDWRKWRWTAEGPEEALAAASSILEAEARRRGLDEAAGDPGQAD